MASEDIHVDTRVGKDITTSIAKVAGNAHGLAMEVKKPKECALALEMLANGETYYAIRKATGFGTDAIGRLKLRHQGAIDSRREAAAMEAEELADLYREVLRRKVEDLLEDPERLAKANPKDLALTFGITSDKAASLRGDANVVVEHRKGWSLEDARAMIEASRKKIDGECIDV